MTTRSPGITVHCADFLTVPLPAASVDLTVTSPPYGVDVQYATFDDGLPYEEYLDFSARWLARCLAVTKADGRLCLNLPLDTNKGGQRSVYADVLAVAKRVGWQYFSTIVWNEQNISRRTAWGSWKSASAPYIIAPVEVIVLLYKDQWRKADRGRSDIERDEFIDWTNGVWTFNGERKSVGHPAPFPLDLPTRCIKLFSYVGDTVLDPFAGSGSTMLACQALGRRGIGVDVSSEYCALIRRRLREAARRARSEGGATPPTGGAATRSPRARTARPRKESRPRVG